MKQKGCKGIKFTKAFFNMEGGLKKGIENSEETREAIGLPVDTSLNGKVNQLRNKLEMVEINQVKTLPIEKRGSLPLLSESITCVKVLAGDLDCTYMILVVLVMCWRKDGISGCVFVKMACFCLVSHPLFITGVAFEKNPVKDEMRSIVDVLRL